ncbi:uncharacterized protein LOC128547416 [Mercenaria mercenaria]|uniref:uncharacterized protein LOC128547416 n=1 Tax=Mercenaria mercenaria TaxID=6596 RepID=UPI00234F0E4F|nr:uncharacterized protein LOC128547416 [Mercenaria mercenaria]
MLLTEHTVDMTLVFLPVTIIIGLFSLLGIIGNTVVIIVYNRKYPTCNFKYFVLVLAGIDLVSCAILMPMEMYTLAHWFKFTYSWLCKIKSFLNVFTVTSSASALLLIAIDRFRKVCKPHSKQIQPQLAIKLTIIILFLSIIPATSDAVFWGIHTHVEGNVTIFMCEKDDEFKDTIWPKLHAVILYAGANSVVMLSTVVLYILIAVKLFCVPSGPVVSTPQIRVDTTTEDTGMVTTDNANKEVNVFMFPVDIESGLSESEDIDSVAPVNQGDITDDSQDSLIEHVKDNRGGDSLKMVQLRQTSEETDNSLSAKKVLRISIQRLSDSCDRNSLRIPDVIFRKAPRSPAPKSPVSPTTQKKKREAYRRRRSTIGSLSKHSGIRLRRKTLIMFILTAVFVGTTVLYFCLIGLMSDEDNHFVSKLTSSEQTAWLFFLRLYFINSVINPILYGFLDQRFRRALWNMGVRVTFAAGSLKRNIGMSIRSRSSTGRNEVTVEQTRREPRSILKSRSSTTVSD